MSPAVDLSPEGTERREHEAEAHQAAARLRGRASHLERRGLRARIGSNERDTCLQQARHIRACAGLLASEFGLEMRREVLSAGWRTLADETTLLAARLKAKILAEIAAKEHADAEDRAREITADIGGRP